VREFNWRKTNEKYPGMLSPTATLESVFQSAHILHDCADRLQKVPEEEVPNWIETIYSRKIIINRDEEEELQRLIRKKGRAAVIQALRKKAEQHEKAAKEMAEDIEWPKKSNWNKLNGKEKRAAINGILIALRVAGKSYPKIRARSILSRTRFEQEMPQFGKHSAAGSYDTNLNTINLAKKDKIREIEPVPVKSEIANIMAHETSHKLGLSHAVTSAVGYYTALKHGYPLTLGQLMETRHLNYSRKAITEAIEPSLENEKEENPKNAYYLGWQLGLEAFKIERQSKRPNAGIAYLHNLARGIGSKEAREAVLNSK